MYSDSCRIFITMNRNDRFVFCFLQVCYLVVDEMHAEFPDLIRDAYWDEAEFQLPYTVAAQAFMKTGGHMGSAVDIK